MTREELLAKAARRMRDVNQRFGAQLPQDKDEQLGLLTEAETCLLRLEQNKDKTMSYTLSPTDAALISRDLLDHPDPDVKLAVTSCLTEVTRLCAPQAPYGDDIMKEIFKRMVDTFAGLGDINSPSYARRLSILDSFSRVKCSVLMLDLNLDHLIRDIFHHCFKAASTNHSENVIAWMENVLRVIIEEGDDVPVDLASCLLQHLTKEAQETFPVSFGLAERVVGSCKDRLKVVFAQLLRGTPLFKYSDIVISLCQDASSVVTNNNADTSITDMEDEGKISEGHVSDESPRETSKIEQDDCPWQDGTHSTISPATAFEQRLIEDDTKSPSVEKESVKKLDIDKDTDEATGPKETSTIGQDVCQGQDGTHPRITSTSTTSNGGSLHEDVKSLDNPASSEQKPEQSSSDGQVKIDQLISVDKELSESVTSETEMLSDVHKLDSSLETGEHLKVSKVDGSVVASEELSPETDDIDHKQLVETGEKAADGSSKPVVTEPAMIKRRGRPPKSQENKQGSDVKSGKVDSVCDSGGRSTRRLIKDNAKPPSTKAVEGESVKKQHIDKDIDEDTGLKEMISTTKLDKIKGQQEENRVSRRKRLQEAEEAPPLKKNKMLVENLVGSRIKVWWPHDKMFYNGVIESFNASSKKHKVAYDDGDVEILLLRKERWELIDEEQGSDPDVASELPRGRRGKRSSSQGTKERKTGTPQIRDPPKKRGRSNGVRSSKNESNTDRPAVTSASLMGKSAEDIEETPWTDGKFKKLSSRITRSMEKGLK